MSRRELASNARPGAPVAALAVVMIAGFGFGSRMLSSAPVIAQSRPTPTVSVNPTSGPAGTLMTFTPSGYSTTCGPLSYSWTAGPVTTVGTGQLNQQFWAPAPDVSGGYPQTITVEATCTEATGNVESARAQFTVTGPARTTTTTTTTTTTAPTTTTTLRTTTTTTASSTTTTLGATTTISPGQTTTTVVPPDSTSTRPGASLKFSALAIAPGSAVSAIGQGCDANAPVAVTIDSMPVGRAAAASDGTFRTPLAVSSLAVGRYQVTAACGPTLEAPLDIVLASEVDQGTSTSMIIIVFFVLLGLLAFRRQLFPGAPTIRSALPPPPDEVPAS